MRICCINNKNVHILSSLQPDLLNFKKGWMVKLDENDQWKKYWFVLSTDSLRYFKDSVTEEASDLKGEIDLTKCYNVSEYQVQRNYGFQIHTPKAVYTLSAMTAGIRKNWIQSLMKNVHPANAPDVARSVMERRREGRYRTFDWAEFRPQKKSTLETDPQRTKSPCSLEMGDLERRRRREERRRRYENMLGFSLSWEENGDKRESGGVRALSPKSQEKVEEEMEECWKQVEKTMFRPERTVPLFSEAKDTVEMEKLVDIYRKGVSTSHVGSTHTNLCKEFKIHVLCDPCERLSSAQATCQRAFASMEDSHVKVVEELQRRHQQEVERLLEERDQLLEEESAATATAIEAIKNAHRLELEREVQRRCQSENNNGNTILEDIHRQHSEELASYQRELEVLSQQFSLKCLENGHLVQAVDAERKALCQCQQENQDLRTRNQVIHSLQSTHRVFLCAVNIHRRSRVQNQQIDLRLITLRVKESEVQSLKQEITSLKDELQSAQRDKRNATKRYKDMYTELSIVRAQTEREMDDLRENLRLAHQALDQTSP
uniref:Myosin phosphatase Rho interacting protein n=1 Tax=Seriola dumerili TaxID=41447 RepID=A0A3B4VFW5_SERDU